jgi:hypothetical protein
MLAVGLDPTMQKGQRLLVVKRVPFCALVSVGGDREEVDEEEDEEEDEEDVEEDEDAEELILLAGLLLLGLVPDFQKFNIAFII